MDQEHRQSLMPVVASDDFVPPIGVSRLAKRLPVHDVVFGARGAFHVTPRGHVS